MTSTDTGPVSVPAEAVDLRRGRGAAFYVVGLFVVLVLAGVVSVYSSGDPDGLERVAEDHGFAGAAEDHALDGSPVADYAVRGVDDERLSVGLAGLAGVVTTLLVAAGLLLLVRRARRSGNSPAG
jgi:hypothetical protein